MQKIKTKTNEQLIKIIETPENYQAAFYKAVCKELPLREMSDEFLYHYAEEIYRKKLQQMLKKSYLNTDDFDLPHSAILSKEQQIALFREEFELNQGRRGDLYEGLDKYMFGG